jgi:carboxypeptidase family protein
MPGGQSSRSAAASLLVAAILAIGSPASPHGQGRPAPSPPRPEVAAPAGEARADDFTGTVTGVAWRADNAPIPQAHVRLRNVSNGRAIDSTVADDNGRFVFRDVPPSPYVVELTSDGGHVLAVGQLFTVDAAQTVSTFVRLSARAPWFTGFFHNAAAAAIAAASSVGITAIGSSGMPASPQ